MTSLVKRLQISDDLALPLDWMQLATVVYGARGAGKTCFGRVGAEEVTKAGQRFCAIDLKGDWYGLKSSASGKRDGIPVVIFGGEHADVPLEDTAGAFVGETVAKMSQSCVLDFELLSKGKQTRFLGEFFEALYHHNREPLLLLLDEAQRYAPQKPGPDEARTLGAVQDIVKLGRKHGIGPVLFTQRGAGLNKEVSELCDLLVAFRTPGPLDQDRIKDWLDANTTKTQRDEVMGKLSGLPTGTAVFASGHPGLRLFGVFSVREPETFDSSATPRIGHRKAKPKKLAAPDLAELREKMSAAIERAKADDPKELRRRIAELEKELKKKAAPAKIEVQKVEVPVPVDWKWLHREIDEAVEELGRRISNALVDTDVLHTRKRAPTVIDKPAQPAARATTVPSKLTNGSAHSEIGKGGIRRMLIALAQRSQGLTNRQLGLRAGLSSKSGTFANYLSRMRQNGWIDDAGDVRRITDIGLSALGSFDPLPEGDELFDYWVGELGNGGASRMLRALYDVYPESLSNEEIGERAGISAASGTFANYLSRLRGLELVTGGRGAIQISEELVG